MVLLQVPQHPGRILEVVGRHGRGERTPSDSLTRTSTAKRAPPGAEPDLRAMAIARPSRHEQARLDGAAIRSRVTDAP